MLCFNVNIVNNDNNINRKIYTQDSAKKKSYLEILRFSDPHLKIIYLITSSLPYIHSGHKNIVSFYDTIQKKRLKIVAYSLLDIVSIRLLCLSDFQPLQLRFRHVFQPLRFPLLLKLHQSLQAFQHLLLRLDPYHSKLLS